VKKLGRNWESMLKVELDKVEVNGKIILKGIRLEIKEGEIHALIGPNACGKTTLAKVIMGIGNYRIKGKILFNDIDLRKLAPEKRCKLGIALAFQNPPVIKGITLKDILERINPNFKVKLGILGNILERELNLKFSGGEKKISELIQVLALNPKFLMLDEIDSGIDVEKLKLIVKLIKNWKNKQNSILLITHYCSILKLLNPDYVHVMLNGSIVCSSKNWKKVWMVIKKYGYEKCKKCKLFSG